MRVIEHQYLHYRNVLVCKIQLDTNSITNFLKKIPESLSIINLNLNGKILMTYDNSNMEFNIPVNKSFSENSHYRYKSEFKLVNAVRARHYGSLEKIEETIMELNRYIRKNSLVPITSPYFMVQSVEHDIYDVLIGISENVL